MRANISTTMIVEFKIQDGNDVSTEANTVWLKVKASSPSGTVHILFREESESIHDALLLQPTFVLFCFLNKKTFFTFKPWALPLMAEV